MATTPELYMQFKAVVDAVTITLDEDTSRICRLPTELHPTSFMADGVLVVSAEDGKMFAHPYGPYSGEAPPYDHYIHKDLLALEKSWGGHWEWRDGGSIAFYFD